MKKESREVNGFHVVPIHPITTLNTVLRLVKKVKKATKDYGQGDLSTADDIHDSGNDFKVGKGYSYSGIITAVYNSYKEILEYRNEKLSYIKNCITSGERKQDCDILGV